LLKAKNLDLGRFADGALMRELVFEHVYSEEIVLVGRGRHPLADRRRTSLSVIKDYTVLLPEPGSIIRPTVDTLLRSRGVSELSDVIETPSPTFGRSYLRLSDAIWIISRGVVADDLRSGDLIELRIDVDVVTLPMQIIRDAIRAVAVEIGLTSEERPLNQAP
jgi:LysR family transcriptional regulator, pca operon transcriptional activator